MLVNYAVFLSLAPHDMRKRLAESMFVGRNASRGQIMADSRVSFVLRSSRSAVQHFSPHRDSTRGIGTGVRVQRLADSRVSFVP